MADAHPDPVFTSTFGDVAENHAGMQKIGRLARSGKTTDEIRAAAALFERAGLRARVITLRRGDKEAVVLVVNGAVRHLAGVPPDAVLAELEALPWDTQALMRGRVVNKHMRHNVTFDQAAQAPDYAAGKGTVVAWDSVPHLCRLREQLPTFFGPKAAGLVAEGNKYPDPSASGIGFHGDGERRTVIAARIGEPLPLHFQWHQDSKPIGPRVEINLRSGDLYAMSDKAVGHDWLKKSIPTLRHAAGDFEFLLSKMKPEKRPLYRSRPVERH
eukprot:m.210087 g.210087  ORF g.210087 m.210087 type:complete len:271 (+) comp18553_c0_seq5:109-921(+)